MGASLIDSFLAIRESEAPNAASINTYPDAQVVNISDSSFRAMYRLGISEVVVPAPYTARQSDFVMALKHRWQTSPWPQETRSLSPTPTARF